MYYRRATHFILETKKKSSDPTGFSGLIACLGSNRLPKLKKRLQMTTKKDPRRGGPRDPLQIKAFFFKKINLQIKVKKVVV